ncbi:3-deoxy-manno-octulosonate cytidylyltransferase [Alteromonas sediminis]|uniref:3-deoxy-manno-octulosonate cytidylyltransferase n=1 Tax=Alteromonas sediminis TaxID=2259342 RepID=A0A3N5Y3H4_9ALTE|nr:3-deoxy-manno-octulosonate cytidylyltransferase [Alteromonas sediminis]RPJ67693.1 3-deoxy-manno-octulosonate cytidylyltransferase [Alteromonas sediminis]
MAFSVIIPARFGSTRFPGKPLADINGKPMINHVVDRAVEAGASQIIVATDDDRIAQVVSQPATVCMTAPHHQSGTERLAEVVTSCGISQQHIVVNVQGDEPFVPAENIQQVATLLASHEAPMATLSTPIKDVEEITNPNIVKVVCDVNGRALYFSRASIPFQRDAMLANFADPSKANVSHFQRHIGIYAYRAGYIQQYVDYAPSAIEQQESLEQLRALWYGDSIMVQEAVSPPPVGIDTPEDLSNLLLKDKDILHAN